MNDTPNIELSIAYLTSRIRELESKRDELVVEANSRIAFLNGQIDTWKGIISLADSSAEIEDSVIVETE